MPEKNVRQLLWLYAVLSLPFFLNDFANIYVKDFALWVFIDYVFVKAVPLAVIAWAMVRGGLCWEDLGLVRLPWAEFLVWAVGMSLIGTLMDQYGYEWLGSVIGGSSLGGIPDAPEGSVLGWIDLHFGLLMVGLMEELIFRGLALSALRKAGLGIGAAVAVSSLVFGLIHWSIGPAAIVSTAAIGAVFALCVWRTRSILPLVVAHFVVNYIYFGF